MSDEFDAKVVNIHLSSLYLYSTGFYYGASYKKCSTYIEWWGQTLPEYRERGIREINFIGWEPFLEHGLDKLLREAKALGFSIGIVTSGILIHRKPLELLRGNIDRVIIVVESMLEDDRIPSVEGARATQAKLIGLAKEAHGLGIDVKLNIVVTVFGRRDDYTRLIEELDPSEVTVSRVLRMDEWMDRGSRLFGTSESDFEECLERHSGVRLSNGAPVVSEDDAGLCAHVINWSEEKLVFLTGVASQ